MTPMTLEDISIAAPCKADWDAMKGDDRKRFCELCHLNVYNLSGMSRQEATALVREKEGRVCVQFYRRADGTVLTADCPIGLQLIRRYRWVKAAIVSCALGFLAAIGAVKRSSVKSCVNGPQQLMGDPALRGRVALPVKR